MAKKTDLIFDQVTEIMKRHTKAEVEFSMSTHITADLAIDSVAMFELIMDVEEQFDIGFSVEEGATLDTVKSLVEAISNKTTS